LALLLAIVKFRPRPLIFFVPGYYLIDKIRWGNQNDSEDFLLEFVLLSKRAGNKQTTVTANYQ
jgi:hypothetical protein